MFLFDVPDKQLIYDIETFPNMFTFDSESVDGKVNLYFEISDRRDDRHLLCAFIDYCRNNNVDWIGFNNIHFDYPVVHFIYTNRHNVTMSVADIYTKAMSIINANLRFAHTVWENDWLVNQIDLFKIHHFDNIARSTSLKVLEFNMRMDSIEDLPFPVGVKLTHEQKDIVKKYNRHDIKATKKFYFESLKMLEFRRELSVRYGRNFMNHNDTKIGKDYFITELEKAKEGTCYKYVDRKRVVQQTPRDRIDLREVIFDYIRFNHDEFNRIKNWLSAQVIEGTKGVFTDVSCEIDGFRYDFGTGGIHGSLEATELHSNDQYVILDIDVKSFYPNIAIENNLHPEHIGELFCVLYRNMYLERVQAQQEGNKAKSDMLKLALNGVYGDSNNEYSPFYDPKYTMSITINGQLLLCMLADALRHVEIKMIQINTDGLTIRLPRYLTDWVKSVCEWWEAQTRLTLEFAEYKSMFIRDVNNYIAVYENGDVKRKGAYEYELQWHQNHSALIVPKATEAYLVRGVDYEQSITGHRDMYDFFLRAKVPRSSTLEHGGEKVSNIVRYYISHEGKPLEKVMPPVGPKGHYKRANGLTDAYFNKMLAEVGDQWDERIHTKNKSTYVERRTGINTGWLTTLCNSVPKFSEIPYLDENDELTIWLNSVNHEWYIQEVKKLCTFKNKIC